MPYGKRSSRQRPHDGVFSSRVPSVARKDLVPCGPVSLISAARTRTLLSPTALSGKPTG